MARACWDRRLPANDWIAPSSSGVSAVRVPEILTTSFPEILAT